MFLAYAIELAPLNIFLYSWRFLATLENEAEIWVVKRMYRWFARVSIVLLPVSFYCIFTLFVI
jgi:hypothetical protein